VSENPLVPEVGEIVLGTIAFAILCFVLMRYAWPKAEQIYQERRDAIEGGLERAERAQQEARATLAQYRAQLAEARSEAAKIREQAHEDGRRIVAEMRSEAEQDREERRQRFETQLESERAQALAQLRAEVGGIALQLAERVLGHELDKDERQKQLVDDFISGLEASPNGKSSSESAPATAGS
jgi:F-type H+-transporting ATPase subunit b